ncbi:uncharacterized protein TRUGW13939_06163 [Talaromyces rugulosus]|uniref:Uncharacterized protein n=1 Tax=Talaromyces rugulosus TaxID=121627 RepID=A0A7H8QY29_TALRU|nr:uncharacterized protein TRUGW13939_06163 [Talaromyces rugulosus]QKX59034.1 hypothetical protein TRUGW13939_06163 [Talaromyces rugulosus]
MNYYYPTPTTPISTTGTTERCEFNGRHFKRRRGTQKWIVFEAEKEKPQGPTSDPYYVYLVQEQNPGPLHWSLFITKENKIGLVYQVTGDAEFMTYQPSTCEINLFDSESFLNAYELAVLNEQQAAVVRQVAENEPPPRAPNRQSVLENCQGWTVRVIAKLVERGIVPTSKLELARSMVEPL